MTQPTKVEAAEASVGQQAFVSLRRFLPPLLLSNIVELSSRREGLDNNLYDQVRPIHVQDVKEDEQPVERRQMRLNVHRPAQPQHVAHLNRPRPRIEPSRPNHHKPEHIQPRHEPGRCKRDEGRCAGPLWQCRIPCHFGHLQEDVVHLMTRKHQNTNVQQVKVVRVADQDDGRHVVGENLPPIVPLGLPQEQGEDGLEVERALQPVNEPFRHRRDLVDARQGHALRIAQLGVAEPRLVPVREDGYRERHLHQHLVQRLLELSIVWRVGRQPEHAARDVMIQRFVKQPAGQREQRRDDQLR